MTDSPKPTPKAPFQTHEILINPEQLYGTRADVEIDLWGLWNAIWAGKWIIVTTTVLFAIAAVVVSLNMPNIYKSTATLIPTTAEEQSSAAALAARFGGLASMAGVSLGGGSTMDKTQIAIETLKSREFLALFIQKHDLKPALLAVESWDASINKLIYEAEIYDEQTNTWNWKSQSNWKKDTIPSDQEAVGQFLEIIKIKIDTESNVIRISISHFSPFIAQRWTQQIISDINQHMRDKDIKVSEKSILYLREKLQETSVAEMKKIFYELIEAQTKTMMLAEVRDEYVLRAIDPATIPEKKSSPKRALICILGVLVGSLASCLMVLVLYIKKMI